MNCQDIQRRLDDYLDGDLPTEELEQYQAHLEHCTQCRQEYQDLQAILDRVDKLPRQIRPSRNLWPGVLARIDTKSAAGTSWWLQLAAAGIALAVLSVPLSVWWMGHQEGDVTPAAEIESSESQMTARAQLARSEDGVLLARTDLVTAIERHRDILEDETLQILEENMDLLDQAIGELRTALDDDPQNLRLRMLLASRYQQERKLLQKVSRV